MMYRKLSFVLVAIVVILCFGFRQDSGAYRTSALGATPAPTSSATAASPNFAIRTVFLIVMENNNWSAIKGSPSAPYINQTLLSLGAHAEAYYNPPNVHPSEPNYIWLEAGTNFNIIHDKLPAADHIASSAHLVTLLTKAGITWKAYLEGIDGTRCPIVGEGLYAPTHNPMVYFDDVTNRNSEDSPQCIAHMRPYLELAGDLQSNNVARYNFITPDLCHDMHNSRGCETSDSIKNGDNWLAREVPQLLASQAYKDGGLILITWDEGLHGDGPIGFIALSATAKPGYSNTIPYTHSSTLRTLQEIFGVKPWLGDAANATDLSDLFEAS